MTLLADLVDVSGRVGSDPSRSRKIRELAQFLRVLEPREIALAVLYLSGDLPQGRLGIGPAALRAAAGAPDADTPSLSLEDVDGALTGVVGLRGPGAGTRRSLALQTLFARATRRERDYLARLLLGDLRQGALGGLMTEAIAQAASVPTTEVRRAAMYAPHLGAVAHAALDATGPGFGHFRLELLTPVAPMLAQVADDPIEALARLGGEAAFEWKIDGARIQVHKSGSSVRVFSRNQNDVGAAIPEIVEFVAALPATELILDGEAVALDAGHRPQPFQVTMRRFGRRLDVDRLRGELPIHAFFFDCLRLGDETLADRAARVRFDALASVVPETARIPRLVTASADAARAFYEQALAAGHEGVMAKSLDAVYEAGNRGAGWLKIKQAHTLDLVILAAEWGHGRRTGKLSNLHLGALDETTGEYVMLGKTFKGLTDRMLEWQTRELLLREARRDAMTVYVRPELVAEVAFSDLQASARYPGGIALRLARVKRYRDDKRVDEADTMATVRRLFGSQRGTAQVD